MLIAFVAFVVAAQPPAASLPLKRATLLRDTGCWLRWEGDATPTNGVANVKIPGNVDVSTLLVERRQDNDWRPADFTIAPAEQSQSAPNAKRADADLTLRITDTGTSTIRVQAFSAAQRWKPVYYLELAGKSSRLILRASITAMTPLDDGVELECAAGAAVERGDPAQPWSDATFYPLQAKSLARGTSSLTVFADAVRADEFALVELGGMVGEPGMRPSPDRVTSMLRIFNKTAKAWPPGELIVMKEGRLVARVLMPHIDAGRDVELPCGRAVGVAVSRDEVELERKTATVRRETDAPDSIQTAGSATITNGNGYSLEFRVVKLVAGDANAASDDAKILRAANRLGSEQPLNEIRWSLSLGPGQSKRLTFGTTIRIPQPAESKDNRP